MDKEITQVTEVKKGEIVKKTKKEKRPIDYLLFFIRECIALSFWVYVLVKLFIFDIDIFIISKLSPSYVWLLDYKFLIIIGTISVIWLITKNKYILSWFFYILFYPMIVLFWRIPFFIFKQKSWVFVFAFINAVISFFKSIKYNFITLAVFLIAAVITLNFTDQKLLWVSIIAFLAILFINYASKFFLVFKPSSIFQVHKKIIKGVKNFAKPSFELGEDIKNLSLENLNPQQLEKWATNLQFSVLFNAFCLFTAKKLKDYQNSRINIVSYIIMVLFLMFLTIFSFAFINYGLFKINYSLFQYSSIPSFFTFFYYSFNNLFFNSIREIIPIMPISQIMLMIELVFASLLIGILVTLLFSTKSQKYAEELDKIIKNIQDEGEYMENFIKEEYSLGGIEDAMLQLERLKGGLVQFIYKIYENIK